MDWGGPYELRPLKNPLLIKWKIARLKQNTACLIKYSYILSVRDEYFYVINWIMHVWNKMRISCIVAFDFFVVITSYKNEDVLKYTTSLLLEEWIYTICVEFLKNILFDIKIAEVKCIEMFTKRMKYTLDMIMMMASTHTHTMTWNSSQSVLNIKNALSLPLYTIFNIVKDISKGCKTVLLLFSLYLSIFCVFVFFFFNLCGGTCLHFGLV